MTRIFEIPRIEDEIERAWRAYCKKSSFGDPDRETFEAGFRAARTFIQTGAQATIQAGGAEA